MRRLCSCLGLMVGFILGRGGAWGWGLEEDCDGGVRGLTLGGARCVNGDTSAEGR